jgi:hypothetical protein
MIDTFLSFNKTQPNRIEKHKFLKNSHSGHGGEREYLASHSLSARGSLWQKWFFTYGLHPQALPGEKSSIPYFSVAITTSV